MPKVDIDYSNTLFYKIYCLDPSINDMYIGHTTNFVQRKHAHKQGCKNAKSSNYTCKLYNFIRANKGWDNWNMEIIAFHNCEDHYSARKIEQKYFEEYNATLNSIAPLPPPKKKTVLQPKKEKQILANNNANGKYICETCDYNTYRYSQYTRHLLTRKHTILTEQDMLGTSSVLKTYNCMCGKKYKHASSLCEHKKTCNYTNKNTVSHIINDQPTTSIVEKKEDISDMKDMIFALIAENKDMRNLLLNQQKQMFEQQQQILKLIPQSENTTNNV